MTLPTTSWDAESLPGDQASEILVTDGGDYIVTDGGLYIGTDDNDSTIWTDE